MYGYQKASDWKGIQTFERCVVMIRNGLAACHLGKVAPPFTQRIGRGHDESAVG
jgi:hypothetical protein